MLRVNLLSRCCGGVPFRTGVERHGRGRSFRSREMFIRDVFSTWRVGSRRSRRNFFLNQQKSGRVFFLHRRRPSASLWTLEKSVVDRIATLGQCRGSPLPFPKHLWRAVDHSTLWREQNGFSERRPPITSARLFRWKARGESYWQRFTTRENGRGGEWATTAMTRKSASARDRVAPSSRTSERT